MSKFHWQRGISFERVTIASAGDAKRGGILPQAEYEPASGDVRLYIGARDEQGFVIPAAEWASIIAAVCAAGETTETYAAAQRFHAEPAP